jgi:hypothetical protein
VHYDQARWSKIKRISWVSDGLRVICFIRWGCMVFGCFTCRDEAGVDVEMRLSNSRPGRRTLGPLLGAAAAMQADQQYYSHFGNQQASSFSRFTIEPHVE